MSLQDESRICPAFTVHQWQKARDIERKLQQEALKAKHVVRVLLLGTGESGKSTVVKQMKIIHMNGFTEKEIENFTITVRGNLIDSMMILVLAMDQLGIVFEKNVSPCFLTTLAT